MDSLLSLDGKEEPPTEAREGEAPAVDLPADKPATIAAVEAPKAPEAQHTPPLPQPLTRQPATHTAMGVPAAAVITKPEVRADVKKEEATQPKPHTHSPRQKREAMMSVSGFQCTDLACFSRTLFRNEVIFYERQPQA